MNISVSVGWGWIISPSLEADRPQLTATSASPNPKVDRISVAKKITAIT